MRALVIKQGQRYGRLTIVEEVSTDGRWRRFACQCDCGKSIEARLSHLTLGKIVSCGCYAIDRRTKHGMYGSNIYRRWGAMIQRCSNPNDGGYDNYGGRGIKVCDRWRSFENFLADMGLPPRPDMELDRIDHDGNYEPGNVRWVSEAVQALNKRKRRKTTSQYRGVSLIKKTGKWCASIKVGGRRRHLGVHDSQEAAARAYDAVAQFYRGFHLNFPIHNGGPIHGRT